MFSCMVDRVDPLLLLNHTDGHKDSTYLSHRVYIYAIENILYGCGASTVSDQKVPCHGCLLLYRVSYLFYICDLCHLSERIHLKKYSSAVSTRITGELEKKAL
jgi:hypothetical protein